MRITRSVALAAAAALAVAGLAGCGSGGGSSPAAEGTGVLNVGMPNGPQTENHNPFLSSSAASSLGYRRVIYEPLVMTNVVRPTDPGKPWLATKWEWSGDYRTLTLTVRDNVTWSDGQPMTAADVAYTFELLKKTPALNVDAIPYGDIRHSGNQVTLTFPKPQFVNQVKILTTFVVPQHQWSKMADPATDLVKQPVGTGPYTLKSFTPQTVTVSLRDRYWQELPKVKEIRYTSYTDNNAQTTALANGTAEWSFVFIPNYKAVYIDKDPEHHKLWFPGVLAIHGLFLNTQNPPFDNPALRRAMAMVINRDDIFHQGEAGYFYPKVDNVTGIPTPAGEQFIAPEFKGRTWKVDVEGAKKELTGAGFRFDGATLVDPTGKPVSITLSNPAGWSDYITDLEIIKDNLSAIGISATVDKANQDAWTTNIDAGQFEASMHWTNSGPTPYDIYQSIMDGALYKPVGTPGVNGNWGRFQNAEATAALEQYANAGDEAARTAAMHRLQRIMVEQMPVIVTSAANAGGEYSTKNWVGWPDEQNQYAPAQPTLINALDIILRLRPA
ncbi:MAG TPA: ABC transporter substrate-binding protein [Actinophytocola sp.]|uniref:ABC transporter substrate-binding protein n=1 Tax=Actinophytocola sp. TaxID=1872138 RepID=UPI002DDD48E6|nr:ABC transporter substrate-binding protein [Actinophytocola sp.]HEV2782335.1 ABC transporter substrate-binding protein [Actinophytocola sp.]